MRRRDFIVAAGGAALVAGSSATAARQVTPASPLVAFLHSGSPQTNKGIVTAFGLGLQQAKLRGREKHPDRIPLG